MAYSFMDLTNNCIDDKLELRSLHKDSETTKGNAMSEFKSTMENAIKLHNELMEVDIHYMNANHTAFANITKGLINSEAELDEKDLDEHIIFHMSECEICKANYVSMVTESWSYEDTQREIERVHIIHYFG